jgi:molybdopterin converting factor small subunit
MAITVFIPSVLAKHAGGARSAQAEGKTVGEVLTAIGSRHPELGSRLAEATAEATAFVTIYLNDEDVRFLDGANTPVSDGDELSLVPAIAGG